MKLATWNVNSIRARLARLQSWLAEHQPDVLCLQETKVEDSSFPRDELSALGYQSAIFGQRSYNGVAILVRAPLELRDVQIGMGDDVDDPQARLIAATVEDTRVVCAYVPNGATVESDKYQYKLAWLARLREYFDRSGASADAAWVFCGDMNVAVDERDLYDVEEFRGKVLFTDAERAALAHVVDWGLADVFRHHQPEGGHYSWWDYRGLGFFKNHGLRIDHIYATPSVIARSISCVIDRNERKGKLPSDHAPVIMTLS